MSLSSDNQQLSGIVILSYVLLVLGLCLPLFTTTYLAEGYNSPRILLLFVGFAFFLIGSGKKSIILPNTGFLILFSSYILFRSTASYFALNFSESIYSTVLSLIILSSLILFHNIDIKKYRLHFYNILLLSNFLSLMFLLYQWLFIENDIYLLSSFFSYKNILSAYLFLTSVLLFFFRSTVKEVSNVLFFVVISLNFAAALLLESRASLIAFIVFFFLLTVINSPKRFRIPLLLLPIVSVLALITYSFNVPDFWSGDSLEERANIWRNTILLIKENPIFGVGPGNWQFEYSQFSVDAIYMVHQGMVSFQNPHNEFLWLLSENGITGSLILCLAFLSLVQLILRKEIYRDYSRQILIFGLLAFSIICFFSFPSERIILLLPLSLIISLLMKVELNNVVERNYVFVKGLLLGICLMGIIYSAIRIHGEYHTKQLIAAKKAGDYKSMLSHASKAESMLFNTDIRSKPLATYKGLYYQQMGQYVKLLEEAEKAYLLSPFDFEVLSNYGYALMKNGRVNEAKSILLEAYRINQHHDPTKLNLVSIYYNEQNYWKALEWLKEVLYYEDKHPELLERITSKLDPSS